MLSIRNVSRLAAFGSIMAMLALAWIATKLYPSAAGQISGIWLGLLIFGVFLRECCRCPRCFGSSVSDNGRLWFGTSILPFWAPAMCPRCQLDLTNRTFWSTDNAALRRQWRAFHPRDRWLRWD
jgi:hypothetical protein